MEDEESGDDDDNDDDHDDGEEGSADGEDEAEEGSPDTKAATKKAAASVSVRVGSFCDPAEANGLAHFLEHMLFMGSEKYPKENDYDEFLSQHGGGSNAFTETEFTTYYFDIDFEHLFPALDRLAQFFVHPLLLSDSLQREVKAVHSEFCGALQSDSCRLLQLYSATTKPNHVLSHFLWGNEVSLKSKPDEMGIDMREKLKELYDKWYVGSMMSVCVLGAEPLDVIEAHVRESFANVRPGKEVKPRTFEDQGFPFVTPTAHILSAIKDTHNLALTWAIPPTKSYYASKPDDYLGSLVGHEGSGSLLSYFRTKGWGTQLVAGVGNDGFSDNSAASLFSVSVVLTQFGLENIVSVIGAVYNYFAALEQSGPQQWLFDEQRSINATSFRFAEEVSGDQYVSDIASVMPFVQPAHLLNHDYLLDEWRPDLITTLLSHLTPSNMRIDLASKQAYENQTLLGDFANVFAADVTTEHKEPWFEFQFKQVKVPETLVNEWSECRKRTLPELHLPEKNIFIPTDFGLVEPQPSTVKQQQPLSDTSVTPTLIPTLLDSSSTHNLWYLQDTVFRVPKAVVRVIAFTERFLTTLDGAVLLDLYVKLVSDSMNHTAYLANLAGLELEVAVNQTGFLDITFHGFHDKLALLVTALSQHLSLPHLTEPRVALFCEELGKDYSNALLKPLKHADNLRLRVLKRNELQIEDKLSYLRKGVRMERVRWFITEILSQVSCEMFVCGNVTENVSIEIGRTLQSRFSDLNGTRGTQTNVPRVRLKVCELGAAANWVVTAPTMNAAEENSAVQLYFQLGHDSVYMRTMADLVSEIIHEPLFAVLRTKEQLGYVVNGGVRVTGHVVGFVIFVQTSTFAVRHVASRIFAFLEQFHLDLVKMEPAKFQSFITSLSNSLQQKDANLKEYTSKQWTHIDDGNYRFRFREEILELLKTETTQQQQVAAFFEQKFLKGEGGRLLTASVKSGDEQATDTAEPNDREGGLARFGLVVESSEQLKQQLSDFAMNYGQ
eukprot:c6309_g1_i2.p1 GENE.c6309_g1_i2~~c6309_g1_i2.p1  ORF type:complete len:1070 (+),score=298.83 c6309_g1_i2:198-3212(+)